MISGLVKWVTLEGMQGRRVAVVCNLKPAKMRGVMSHGMVRCRFGIFFFSSVLARLICDACVLECLQQ